MQSTTCVADRSQAVGPQSSRADSAASEIGPTQSIARDVDGEWRGVERCLFAGDDGLLPLINLSNPPCANIGHDAGARTRQAH
jgi:hypothetical protein